MPLLSAPCSRKARAATERIFSWFCALCSREYRMIERLRSYSNQCQVPSHRLEAFQQPVSDCIENRLPHSQFWHGSSEGDCSHHSRDDHQEVRTLFLRCSSRHKRNHIFTKLQDGPRDALFHRGRCASDVRSECSYRATSIRPVTSFER